MKSAFSYLPHWPLVPDAVFWVGLTLLTAGLCGELCWKAWRLPRITGYSIIGLLAGSAGFGVIDSALANDARFLMDVALGMLLFELGSRLSLRWIRKNPWLIATSLAEATLTFAMVMIVLQLIGVPLMTTTVIASIAIATSPTMVIQLKNELKSEGQVTERLLALTALNSMYAVVLLELVSTWMHQEYYGNLFATLTEPLYLIVGSLAVAYVLARSCRRVNLQDEHSFVILIGLVLLAIAITHMLELSTLLALLAAGIILKNFDPRPQLWPAHFGTAGWLLTVVLFVITLISFQWNYVALGGFAALAMIAARMLAKLIGVLTFAKPSGINVKQGVALGLALAPMSAFAYLLVENTYNLYPDFDPQLRAIMLCAIVILQLFTPLLVYSSLSSIGERRQ
ncbi:cation:proton antiporter [Mycoavidus sp. SF9855]|uniref:cation:proton antiporter n=1 Tax=Mycoavidus sp. SF9855 TaxID=2968475 RepID=UPI00211D09F1|nr:cation:proton antiporter [Mycoavidus sp. SF9855]UUM21579.1 cation:proton antiporter [Mycoavidus sp. SF9855]